MRRALTALVAVTVMLLGLMAAPAGANGVSPDKLENAGWLCFNVPTLGVHCTNNVDTLGELVAGEEEAISVLVFDSESGEFEGTELLIHDHLFNDQPCPQDGGHYHDLTGEGLPYFACHHYDSAL